MKKPLVTVLLSTYNGERFLKEQIDSIIAQEGVKVRILVRDDGSSDSTLQILHQYGERLTLIKGENVGPALSFVKLMEEVSPDADYYAFADQDDIWIGKKLLYAVQMIGDPERPVLYSSNQILVDAKGNKCGMRYSFIPPTDVLNIIDKNYLAGCTMVMTRSLLLEIRSKFPAEELLKSRMHDTWCAAVAAGIGSLIYDSGSYILYRQHESNVVGAAEAGRIKRLWNKLSSEKNNYYRFFADELEACFGNQLNDYSRHVVELYRNTDNLRGKIHLLRDKDFQKHYFRNKTALFIKLLGFTS